MDKMDFPKLTEWREHPDIFCQEIFGITLEPWQKDVICSINDNDRISIASGHGCGKSTLLSLTILWYLSTRTPARIIVTAPTASQLFTILWSEVSLWLRNSKYNFSSIFTITEDTISLKDAPKENFCVAKTARKDQPEALQGQHSKNTLLLLDEASGISNNVFEVIAGSMSTKGSKTIMTSNPTRTSGYFYDSFHKFRDQWKTFRVSCFDSSRVDPKYIESMAKYGLESNIYKVRVLGEFPHSDDDAIIGLDLIESAIDRGIEPFGEIVWGVDVARFGDARTALAKRHGPKLLEPVRSWVKKDTMETSGIIKLEYDSIKDPAKRPSKIVVDVIGLGAGVVDRLKELGLPVVGVNVAEIPGESEKYLRMRDELWFNARDWFTEKVCDIPDDAVLISQLSALKYFITSNGKLRVESKDELKKRGLESPDIGDAFVLTFCKENPRKRVKPVNRVNENRQINWMGL